MLVKFINLVNWLIPGCTCTTSEFEIEKKSFSFALSSWACAKNQIAKYSKEAIKFSFHYGDYTISQGLELRKLVDLVKTLWLLISNMI